MVYGFYTTFTDIWLYYDLPESLLEIRRRYWAHLRTQRREAAFPTRGIPPIVRSVRKVRPFRPPAPGATTIRRIRFQRKRRQVVQTHLRSL